MPDTREHARRYNDREVALIIKRAAELQESETTTEGATTGMSLVELQQVARDAGLDPELVRRAALDLDTRTPAGTSSRFLGAPTALRFERTVQGEVPDSEYEALVDEIRRAIGEPGLASTLGRTLTWTSTVVMGRERSRARQVTVTISPRQGRTTIRVEESTRVLAGALFGALMGGVGGGTTGISLGIGLGALHSVLAAAGLWSAVFAGSYALARTLFTRRVSARERQLRELMDRLVERVTEATEGGSGEQGAGSG